MCDVTGDTEQVHGRAMRIVHNRTLDRDPPGLTGMGVARRGHDPILSLPVAAGALGLCNSVVDAFEVVRMHETPGLSNRGWQHAVPMKLCSPLVTCELTGSNVRTECAKRRSIKGQLEALPALLKRRFTAAPLGE